MTTDQLIQFITFQRFCSNSKFIFLFIWLIFPWILYGQNLQITEFMASNSQTLADEDGEYADWIEIYNPTNQTINLSGWFLSDDKDQKDKWKFPPENLASDEYLIVFASGKDRQGDKMHTNFRLSSSGERLYLLNPSKEVVFSLEGKFPQQYTDISYAWVQGGWHYSDLPTPGAPNGENVLLTGPVFSHTRGFYEQSFNLVLSSPISGGQIIYTLDGSLPTENHGKIYRGPITINATQVVRAIARKEGNNPSRPITHTYIFPASVIDQTDTPPGYPDRWGLFSQINGVAPADYEMDPEITQSPDYKEKMIPALTSLPTISLVTDKNYLFSHSTDPDTGGIYIFTAPPTGGLGVGWERPVSFEYIMPDGSESVQADAGVRIHGGHSRVPEKSPKHSFRVVFRGKYGQKKLNHNFFGEDTNETFDNLVLRAGFNQTWLHWSSSQRELAQYINDSWVKHAYRKMGYLSAHQRFVHLYINGLYWGVYDLTERMDKDFMAAYIGGQAEDFDVIKDYAELADGEHDAWKEMMAIAADVSSFMRIQGKNESGEDDAAWSNYLNMESLIDYMILNFYIGNQDWDHHNWVAARNRQNPGKGFQFIPWDSERTFINPKHNIVEEDNFERPSYLYQQFREDVRFRELFSQRVELLLGSRGILSPDSVAASWQKLSSEIELAIIAESARWGDYRRDKHSHQSGKYELYTKNDHWDKEQLRLYEDYFPLRSQTVYQQLTEIGLAGDLQNSIKQHGAFPNPFSSHTSIYYRLIQARNVDISIYDLQGRLIQRLFTGLQTVGLHQTYWIPEKVNNGLYIYRIQLGAEQFQGKIFLYK